MKITTALLRSKATGPLPSLEYLDLSQLGLASIEKLSSCPKLQTLKLRGNNICEVYNLEYCTHLWHLDFSNNKIQCLDGLSRFLAVGTLILAGNNLTWKELVKIRHLHILNLSLHGNPHLEKDPYYRIHVIDCLPNIWMLDGRIVTSAERLQVKHFFQDSALTEHPVRHKLGREWFIPSALKKIQVNGIFGDKSKHLLTKFPINAVHNIEIDQRRLKYLAFNLQEDLTIERKYTKRDFQVLRYRRTFLEDLLDVRPTDRERCNMLLLLLVASLEFVMPTHLVKETLETAKLGKIGKVYTMDLFLLPKDVRCQVVGILLSAIKVDKDIREDGGLYDRLYLCLFYTVAELTRLSQSNSQGDSQTTGKMHNIYRDYKCLLASEIVQLMCIVPAFFEYMEKDVGVMNLVTTGTGDRSIIGKISQLAESYRTERRDVRALYEDIAEILLQKVQEQTMNLTNKSPREPVSDKVLSTSGSVKRAKTPVDVSEYHMKGVTSPDSDPPVVQCHTPRKNTPKFPHLGDVLLLGPQTIGKVISLPQPFLALVAMDAVPVSNGAMVSKLRDSDDHYTYVNMRQLEWDVQYNLWKPLGTVGDRYTIQSTDEMRKELERRAAIIYHTSRPNSPDSAMLEPPAREPTPLIYTSYRPDTPLDTPKPKLQSHRPPRPMSSILKEKLDLKLDMTHRAQSARVVRDQYRHPASAGATLATSHSAHHLNRQDNFTKAVQNRKSRTAVRQILDDCVSLAMDIGDGDAEEEEEVEGSVQGSLLVQIDGHSTPSAADRQYNRSDPDFHSDEEPELQSLHADNSKSPSSSSKGGNYNRPASELPPPVHFEVQLPSVLEGESEPNTGRERGTRAQGKLRKGITNSVHSKKATPGRSSRPFSAVDAYRYFVTAQPASRPQSGYNTDFQRARTEVWKKRASVPSTPTAKQPPLQRPTSPALTGTPSSRLHIHRAEYWMGGGRDLYWEQQLKRPKSGHTPGWKDGLPDSMKRRPKSAVAMRTLRRSKAPNVITPSSIAYEAMLAGYSNPDLPQLPNLSDYRPLSQQLGLPRRLGSPPPGVEDFYAEPTQDTVYSGQPCCLQCIYEQFMQEYKTEVEYDSDR
ncbi:uncharacterized protein LOC124288684 [Haliotis rubra]|uniref:uncharacterized protein LOC124288684 n=1 Tax=Haliotis rubra TaxID=36100 RepID=UPI001EE57CE6|nr:uncharacterized protein LOC124288684 [Haliotis rubra]